MADEQSNPGAKDTALGAARQLAGTRPAALPAQRTFWGWVRAALAFQAARPAESPAAPGQDAEAGQ